MTAWVGRTLSRRLAERERPNCTRYFPGSHTLKGVLNYASFADSKNFMATTSGSFVCLRANFRRRVRIKSNVLKLSTEQPVRANNVGQTCRNAKCQVVRSRRAPGILTKITVREARANYNQNERNRSNVETSL